MTTLALPAIHPRSIPLSNIPMVSANPPSETVADAADTPVLAQSSALKIALGDRCNQRMLADKLQYITERYDALCNEMISRGYTCNRVDKQELEQGIDRSLFFNYSPTDAAIKLNRDRINLRLAESEAKKLLKKEQK